MAPANFNGFDTTTVTQIYFSDSSSISGWGRGITSFGLNLCSEWEQKNAQIPETKKQIRDRVSKEKMFASWETYNLKTPTVKEIKQICKPQHRINYSGRRV